MAVGLKNCGFCRSTVRNAGDNKKSGKAADEDRIPLVVVRLANIIIISIAFSIIVQINQAKPVALAKVI